MQISSPVFRIISCPHKTMDTSNKFTVFRRWSQNVTQATSSVVQAVFRWLSKPTWSQWRLETCIFTTFTWSHFTPNLLVASEEESGDHQHHHMTWPMTPHGQPRGAKGGKSRALAKWLVSLWGPTMSQRVSLMATEIFLSGPQWCKICRCHLQSCAG